MIIIPFAGYPDFDACVKDQMRKHKGQKGFTIENARKICGAIKHKVEDNKFDDVNVIIHKNEHIEVV